MRLLRWVLAIVGGVLGVGLVLFWLIGERGRFRKSTWQGLRANGLRNVLNFKALHMYVYGRWTNLYVRYYLRGIFRSGDKRRAQRLVDHYHGKVLTHDHAQAIVTLDHDIPLQDLEQIVPYPAARNLVLKGPPDVVAYECCCRHSRENPCRPTQVCMAIGQPFVDFILEHHPKGSGRLSRDEALQLLEEEHQRGHLHSAWFKDVMLDRFYAICNCCQCCCAGIEAMTKCGMPMMASSGYVAKIDTDACNACGACVKACPFEVLSLNDTSAELDWEKCMGCGVCVAKCPEEAVSLVRDEKKGVPLDVRVLG